MSDKVIQMDSWPYKRRTFPTYLKEAFLETWFGRESHHDPEPETFVQTDFRPIETQPYQSWRQIPSSVAADIERGYNEVHGIDWNDPKDLRNLADAYAEWSDEHHRLSSEVAKHVGFYTVDEDDLEHLEPEDDDDDSD